MTRLLLSLLGLLTLPLAACTTDDDDAADDDHAADDDDAADGFRAVVLHGTFVSDAIVATLDEAGGDLRDDQLALVGSDWALNSTTAGLAVIGRFGTDAVRLYDGLQFGAPALEFSTGSPSNPQAVAVCDGKVFVTRYGLTDDGAGGDVAIYDLSSGGPLGTVDLSDYLEGTDGTPEPAALLQDGATLYVALQRIDRDNGWTPDAVGTVVAIDCTTEAVVDAWDVAGNPSIGFHPGDPTQLLVRGEGALQVLDTVASTVTDVIDEAALGHSILGVGGRGDDLVLVTESAADSVNHVWCLTAGDWTPTELTTLQARNWGVRTAPDGSVWTLWIDHWATPDDAEAGGLHVIDPTTCSVQTDTLVSLPSDPIDLAFVSE
jgi:hypothetical protein